MADVIHEDIQCPSILFRLNGSAYCVNSRYVSSIMKLPKHQPVPDSPDYITGIFPYRGGSVTMFNLRTALKQTSLEDDFNAFSDMVDARKNDHIRWVNALNDAIQTGQPFALATDPHQCALGKWYDAFHSDSAELTSHLAKLVEPHKKLHESARMLKERKLPCGDADPNGQDAQIEQIYQKAHDEYMPHILKVLDDAKMIFRDREFNEMVLVLSGNTSLGLVVDEVLAVGAVAEEAQGIQHQILSHSPYIERIVRSDLCPGELILEVSVPAILRTADEDEVFNLASAT